MDFVEARAVLAEALTEYRLKPYHELKGMLGQPQVSTRRGASGAEYQVEIESFWDVRPHGDIRVLGTIDHGSVQSLIPPVSDDFIVAPNGRFVRE